MEIFDSDWVRIKLGGSSHSGLFGREFGWNSVASNTRSPAAGAGAVAAVLLSSRKPLIAMAL